MSFNSSWGVRKGESSRERGREGDKEREREGEGKVGWKVDFSQWEQESHWCISENVLVIQPESI